MNPVSVAIKRYLPKSLLGRSLMIIVMPLVILQLVSAAIFYETHWDTVTLRLARGVAGDVAAVISMMRRNPGPENESWIFDLAGENMELVATLKQGAVLPNNSRPPDGLMERMLTRALKSRVGKPFVIDSESEDKHVIIDIQLARGVLRVITPRKRLFSSTTYVFVIWMVGTSLILFAVATIFMRNQVKPIRRLAIAADDFGMGRDVSAFKPEGAAEVRLAASAFLIMRERILRQIAQRTDMLSGVSHDLRTPLTRMRLQLEMLENIDGVDDLKSDIAEMEHMLDGYLAFARGEGEEEPRPMDLTAILDDAAAQARRKGGAIDLHTEGQLTASLRPIAFKRCVTNLIDNAMRYGDHVSVRAGRRDDAIEITVDDDGPGIPEDERQEVFKPFYRIEGSRNPGTGGVGLGLTITRDVLRGHGGDIELSASPNGGLRARIRLPL
ncbi:MAG: two-component sensor histidine kinase [Rhodospirillales bacterium]|nr:two-component sensor histidine kinase [Rhodospirillales bacterium]